MQIYIHLSLFLLLLSNLHAENKFDIDNIHKNISTRVVNISTLVDEKLVDVVDSIDKKENNVSLQSDKILEDNKKSIDEFFINDRYLDTTEKSYVSVRTDAIFRSIEDNEFNFKVSAHLALNKSKHRLNLFINDLDQDNAKNLGSDSITRAESTPEIGFNYFNPDTYGVRSKYSIGIRGIYPFVRARYSKEILVDRWIIEPVQTFRYSVKDYFQEDTQVFFDTKVSDLSLVRLYIARGTKSGLPGMSYDGSINIFWNPVKGTGINLYQGFNGSTKYQHANTQSIPIVYEDFNGIYNYATSVNVRQNFYKKWLFIELQPGVNFHKQHDYEANYTVRILFDLFFGNI